MRRLLSLLFLLALLIGVILPALYFYFASGLPDLSTRSAVTAALAPRVQAAREASKATGRRQDSPPFQVSRRANLPKALVIGLLAIEACPDYLEAPPLADLDRFKLVLARAAQARVPAGPGRCRLRFADMVTEALGVIEPVTAAISDAKLLASLEPDDLLTFRLAATFYSSSIIGAFDASRFLFGKDLEKLTLAQAAELLAAESYWQQFVDCTNPPRLTRLRDDVLDRMKAFGGIDEAELKRAKLVPVSCSSR